MRLRTHAHVAFYSEGGVTLQLGTQYFQVADLQDEASFWSVRRFATGALDADEIARLANLSEQSVEASLEALRAGGIAYDVAKSEAEVVTGDDAASLVALYGEMWREHLFRDPIFNPDHASPLIWLGFLAENWHRARRYPEIAALAQRQAAGDSLLTAALGRLGAEEEDHAPYYEAGVNAFGIDAARFLANSSPIYTTRALSWFLEELAAKRPLSFLAVCRLTESEAADEQAFSAEAAKLAEGYGVDMAAVAPVLEHGRLDASASHKLLIDEVLKGRETWPSSTITTVLQDMHDFRHAYGALLSGVREHYGGPTESIPNRIFRWSDFPK